MQDCDAARPIRFYNTTYSSGKWFLAFFGGVFFYLTLLGNHGLCRRSLTTVSQFRLVADIGLGLGYVFRAPAIRNHPHILDRPVEIFFFILYLERGRRCGRGMGAAKMPKALRAN